MNDKMALKQDFLQIMNESIRKVEGITPHSKIIDSFSSAQNKLNRVLNPIDKHPMTKMKEEMNHKLEIMTPVEFLRKQKSNFQTIWESARKAST